MNAVQAPGRQRRYAGWWIVTCSLLLLMASLGLEVTPASAAVTVAPPDMVIVVPTNLISVGTNAGASELRFTHRTENAGTGPFEIDPTYNPSTGIASFRQALYGNSTPGVWTFDHSVPVAINGAFVNGSDYRWPLTKFTLNMVNGDGSIGSVVATSPKTDYCITGDYLVGGVPNTPAQTSPPASNCNNPNDPLGWSVGWADQYDQTDSGQPIPLTGVANGTYVLRAIVDPQHLLTESDATNNVTDTLVTISGTSVTVGAQTHPALVPPSIALTSPTDGSNVSGTVTMSVSVGATAPATISSVQYLLDGNPLGAPQTTSPFGYSWTVGSTAVGNHRLSAQVTDSSGSVGTAPVETVNVRQGQLTPGFSVDQTVTQTGRGATTSPAFSTGATGETLLAFVASDGPSGAQTATVSGGGLSWTLVKRANAAGSGTAEIWKATAASQLAGTTVTSTPATGGYDQQLTVVSFAGAAGVGAAAAGSAASGPPSVGLTSTAAGSLLYGVGNDFSNAIARTVGSGQNLVAQWLDVGTGDTFWTQTANSGTSAAGLPATINDTAPTSDRWNVAAAEIVPSGSNPPPPPDTAPPVVSLTNPAAGQTVSGMTPVAATATDNVAIASVQFLLDGVPLGVPQTAAPYSVAWDTTTVTAGNHALSADATDTAGNVGTSAATTVNVANPAPPMTCFVMQAQKSVHVRGNATTPAIFTAITGETLVAFVSADGPKSAASQTAAVTGAGLTWKLIKRANGQYGDSEIWAATAATQLTDVTVKSSLAKSGYDQDLTVIAMEGVAGVGASVSASAASGAPTVRLITTAATSLVFAVGNDWDASTARTLPAGQVILDQWLDSGTGDTFWSEYTNQAVTPQASVLTIGTTAPANHRWNLAAVELTGDGA